MSRRAKRMRLRRLVAALLARYEHDLHTPAGAELRETVFSMRPKPFGTSIRKALVALACMLALPACGLTSTQRAAVRNFSQATAAFGEASAGEFAQMRDATISMNTARAELAGPGEKVGPLEGAFTVEAVMVRTQAANTLGAYGELLQALVDDTQEKELQTAADRFVASVRGLPGTEKNLNEAQLASIGKLVQLGGSLLVEAKKKDAIRQIVPEADPQVAVLCDLLAADFDPDGARLGSQFMLAANLLLTDAGTVVRRAKDPETRATATAAYQLASTSRARKDAVLARASTAARELKTANRALTEAINSDDVSPEDLYAYAATVQTLVEAIKVLR